MYRVLLGYGTVKVYIEEQEYAMNVTMIPGSHGN